MSAKNCSQTSDVLPAASRRQAKSEQLARSEQLAKPVRRAVPELQRQLLMAGMRQHNGRLWFAKSSADTLAMTYAALISLQRKKLIAPEKAEDPRMMSWKITKSGKAAVTTDKPRRR